MKRSNRLVLLVGIFLAVVAFILIAAMLSGGQRPNPNDPNAAPTTTKIVIAKRDFAAGTKITTDDLTTKDVAVTEKPAGAQSEVAVFIGQTARKSVTKDQLITTDIITGGAGQVTDIEVPPGKVAMSVKVDQVSGVGTVIKPGDYVDAVVAFDIQVGRLDDKTGNFTNVGEPGTTVKALLQGMQVLGTLLPPRASSGQGNATPAPDNGQTSFNDQQQIVILAVDLQQAEVLNYAQVKGKVAPNGITLVLRSTKDFQDAAGQPSTPPDTVTTGVILRILIEQYGVLVPDFGGQNLATPTPRP